MVRFSVLLTFALAMSFAGCATERTTAPTIEAAAREGLNLQSPIMASVFDGRSNISSQEEAIEVLKTDLTRIYGSNLEWVPYFEEVPSGRVAVRIRLVTLGASFGSRLISSAAYANAVQSAQLSATAPWEPVVGTAAGSSSVFATSFSGEGWWNGAAWVDLEIQDNRGASNTAFTVPFVAEHRESNMWGYSSGDKAAKTAWKQVSAQLIRGMDAVLRAMSDQE
ncbi:hypothetical protein GCM10007160_42910 [Litchfieldella qijiaojingensis]|uniref:Lipoprotein n=1 Tax=Litchfieldella qijiaojingensis TaxID=980347 RepID=A0ABQ2ZBP2_9GAMM|nr:hypothetical protein [Halomonas qijiaojingensis]GGY11304.1 hypothetical protein GCM10007160_42910 [Halomonas qijiaojingensis]